MNHNTFVTDAINIKSYPLSENDNIVVMFSKDRGLIKGVAKGVKKPKSKLGARMQSLVCNKLMLNEGKKTTYQMETIEKTGITGFVKNFNLIKFKCSKIEYNDKTKKISKKFL